MGQVVVSLPADTRTRYRDNWHTRTSTRWFLGFSSARGRGRLTRIDRHWRRKDLCHQRWSKPTVADDADGADDAVGQLLALAKQVLGHPA